MRKSSLLLAGSFLLTSLPVVAQDGIYAGVNLTQIHYKETGFDTAKPIALVGRFGKLVNENFAVEGRLGIGVADDSVDVFGTSVDVEVDQMFGIYARGILPVTPTFSAYGLLGYTDGELTASVPGDSVSVSDSDVSFGVGADISIGQGSAVNIEYAKFISESDYDVYGWSIGFVASF